MVASYNSNGAMFRSGPEVMATSRITHIQRERAILFDLEDSFPKFMGRALLWDEVPNGQDPPDFISSNPDARIGLELREWLDGDQMRPAKIRESRREEFHGILSHGWENEYQPKNFRGAFSSPRGGRVSRADELPLRREFFALAAEVDRRWADNSGHWERSYYETEFAHYPLLRKYFSAIRYIRGKPHGSNWIGGQGDGGAFDPKLPVGTLTQALDSKLSDYSTAEQQAHLKMHNLTELSLLVHGGFNIYAYNTPSGHISLDQIARHGAAYYSSHALCHIFNRVWFFHSLDTEDDLNRALGFAPGAGRVRWLAQLWPEFRVYAGSIPT
jgi:hypothetical protein